MADIFPGTLILATDPGDLGRNCLGPHRTDWLKRPPNKSPAGGDGARSKRPACEGVGGTRAGPPP